MSLTPSSLGSLANYSSTLSVLLNDQGGIIDDTIITKHSNESFYVVTNAGRSTEDKAHIDARLKEWNGRSENKGKEVKWETMDGWGLVALQGPKAAEVLQTMVELDLTSMKFGQSAHVEIDGAKCHIARGGYTGEDGFEVSPFHYFLIQADGQISIPPQRAVEITQKLASHADVQLIGLGARDSLRLEAGMCLYGNDLDESVSPVEAGLTWVIGKSTHFANGVELTRTGKDRRTESSAPFPGRSRILQEIANGPIRRRVGFEIIGSPAREGCKIFDPAGVQEIGVITSGIPSPTLGANIAMGYVANGQHKKGTKVQVEVRKKMRDAIVRPMPFVPSKYYK